MSTTVSRIREVVEEVRQEEAVDDLPDDDLPFGDISLDEDDDLPIFADPEPVQRHRRKRAQKNPGQKLASEKKKGLDKRIGMVYNGSPYCDSMPIYAIPYYMSILTQVAAVVKREVCEF